MNILIFLLKKYILWSKLLHVTLQIRTNIKHIHIKWKIIYSSVDKKEDELSDCITETPQNGKQTWFLTWLSNETLVKVSAQPSVCVVVFLLDKSSLYKLQSFTFHFYQIILNTFVCFDFTMSSCLFIYIYIQAYFHLYFFPYCKTM